MKKKFLYLVIFGLSVSLIGCGKPVDNVPKQDEPVIDNVIPNETTDKSEDSKEETKDNEEVKKEESIKEDKPQEVVKPEQPNDKEENPKEEINDKKDEDFPQLTSEQLSAKKIVDQIINSSMSDLNKALAIHDWLTFNIDYDQSYSVHTVKETLSKRVAVCDGYARTFQMMAELSGLEANVITGEANGPHAWNQVKINGIWYNVDVTWDDPLFEGKQANDHKANNYDYFLISNATMNKDHTPDMSINNAPKDYDKVTILKAGLSNGYRKNHSLVTNQTDANEVIKKYVNAGYNEFYMWYYNPNVTQDNMSQYFTTLIEKTTYPVNAVSAILHKAGVTVYKVNLTIPLSEWNSISVVHNAEEFANSCNTQYDSETTEFMIRYESVDGSFDMTGVKFGYRYSYTQYGITRLYKITPMT